jgi:ABC-type transporter Mla subunit MlaD
MSDLLAKGVAVTVAVLLAGVIGILVFTSRPPAGAQTVVAEFDNAFPLIEGMYVRVDGAIAGSVGTIEVNDEGNAEVRLILNDSIEPAQSDATAAIRQQDTTGDSYVAFEPGDSGEDLGEDGIVCSDFDSCENTLVAPRLDDLLNAFGPSERAGIKLILVETAKALDRRGADLNAAALELKPALEQTNIALAQVSEQNEALKRVISSTENVTGQAAKRDEELGDLIGSLAATLDRVETETASLDAGLERLPETTRQAETTLAQLTAAATAARPLAEDTAAGAPLLASSLERFPGFLDNASAFMNDTRSTLKLTQGVLDAAQPTLEIGAKNVVTGSFDLVGATADLLNSTLGGEDAFPALFGDDSYGEGEGTLGKRGFGAVAVEPGNLPGYGAEHEPRNWLRVSAVINCEALGAPIRPGCLLDVLNSLRAEARSEDGTDSDNAEKLKDLAEAAKSIREGGRPDLGDIIGGNGDGDGGGRPDIVPPDIGDGSGGNSGGSDGGSGSGSSNNPLDKLDEILEGAGLGKGGLGLLRNQQNLPEDVRPYRDLLDFLVG